ncbi:hypothetical protein [Streptomyces antimicrobicus]|uniref:Zinc-finger domain-containing protein n=1 Tax=Streptomyces antimicrobicus TaxID=2883108 RepID=A0ABS8B0F7_9ACTN|nr:hypothetical protein [Streptomyces antimicrobicus]MCB5178089.1 hypothetical protein [Streptomyces antimicrobicus]
MSPTQGAPGAIRHPDVSEISDLAEGLLSPARTAEVRRHLGDCLLCADVRTSLEEIRSLLGTLPGPPRIPADIAGRIDAALAAEALLSATAPVDEEDEGAGDRRPTTAAAEPARHVSRETAPPVSRETTPAPTRPAGRARAGTGPGRTRRRAVLAGLVTAAALGLGAVLIQLPWVEQQQGASQNSTVSALQPQQDASSFSEGGLQAKVQELVGGPERNRSLSSAESQPGLAPAEREAPAVPACVRAGTGRTEAALATEPGTYKGVNVLLVVLPHPSDPAQVDAYLVDSSCGTTPAAAPGKVLLTATYPRR